MDVRAHERERRTPWHYIGMSIVGSSNIKVQLGSFNMNVFSVSPSSRPQVLKDLSKCSTLLLLFPSSPVNPVYPPRHDCTCISITQLRDRRIPSNRAIFTCLELLHLLSRQAEINHIRIVNNARRSRTLRQRNKSLLQTPPNKHLRLRPAVLLCRFLQCRLVQAVLAQDGTVCPDSYVALRSPVHGVAPCTPRVHLHLVHAQNASLALALTATLGL